jgi:peroxiredoxin Q/BCP
MKGSRQRISNGIALALLLTLVVLGIVIGTSMESRSDLVSVGRIAPDFTSRASDGVEVHLAGLQRRQRVVLVFYPGDYTPVCTAQLCSFRDNWAALQAANTVVYGINPAALQKHAGFAAQNRLPFPLIMDAEGTIARQYGCRALFGIVKRTVYVIDRNGRIAWVERGNPSPLKVLGVLHDLKDAPLP